MESTVHHTQTGPDGVFRFANLPRGYMKLAAWASGYMCENPLYLKFDPAEAPSPVVLRMVWTGPAEVSVRFALADGRAYMGVVESIGIAFLKNLSFNLSFLADTKVPGNYELRNLSAGLHLNLKPVLEDPDTILVPTYEETLDTVAGRNPMVVFTVFGKPRIAGRVVDPSGTPVAGIAVWISKEKETNWRSIVNWSSYCEDGRFSFIRFREHNRVGKTGEDGRFSFSWSEPGERYIVAMKQDGDKILMGGGGPFRLVCGKTVEIGDVVLRQKGVWAGQCRVVCTLHQGLNGPLVKNAKGRYSLTCGTIGGSDSLCSDEQGRISMVIERQGTYSLLLEMDGYGPFQRQDIRYEEGKEYIFDVALDECLVELRVRIEAPQEVAAGMSVNIHRKDYGTDIKMKKLPGNGQLRFQKLTPGVYDVSLDHTGPFVPQAVRVALASKVKGIRTLASGEELVFRLARGAVITGRVLYADGTPAYWHGVFAALEEGTSNPQSFDIPTWEVVNSKFSCKTEKDGSFLLQGLPGGQYKVSPDDDDASEIVRLALGEKSKPLVFKLASDPPVKVAKQTLRTRVRVFYPDGKPAPGATVKRLFRGRWSGPLANADATGSVDLWDDHIYGGVACYSAVLAGYAPSPMRWIRLNRVPDTIDLHLRKGAVIYGHAHAPEKGVQGNRYVEALFWEGEGMEQGGWYLSMIEADGSYRISDLPPGRFQVFLWSLWGGDDNVKIGTASLHVLSIHEGDRRRLNLDCREMGVIKISTNLDEEEENSEEDWTHAATFWPENSTKSPYPCNCPLKGTNTPRTNMEQSLVPGAWTAGITVTFDHANVWIVKTGVQVSPGNEVGVRVDFLPETCGAVEGRLKAAEGEGCLGYYGLFLWNDGVRVLVRAEASGRISFDKIPQGTYKARLIWGTWWTPVRDLKPIRIEKGKTVNIGTVRGMD
jgi:hypothetical protein